MDFRRASQYSRDPSFWRGFRSGLVKSMNAPANRARMQRNFRLSMYSAIIGSLAMQWLQRSRAAAGGYSLTNSETFGASLAGAIGAVAIVSACSWTWRRLRNRPAA